MPFDPSTITTGRINKPPKGIVYGIGGCGKSTFAAYAPNPFFIQTEAGSDEFDIARSPVVKDWKDIFEIIKWLGTTEHGHKTLVIDSLDHAEPLLHKHLEAEKNLPLEKINGGFYRWRAAAAVEWRDFDAALCKLRDKKGMAVIQLAHYKIKVIEDPRFDSYERIQLKLDEAASSLLYELNDFVGFLDCDKKAIQTNDEDRKRVVSTGQRKLFLSDNPAYQSKGRRGLPEFVDVADHKKGGNPFAAFAEAWKAANP